MIGERTPELTTAEIDARDLVAIRAVTVGAGIPESATTVFDIESCGVLSGE